MKKDTGKIIYTEKGAEGLDLVCPLWEKLRVHHKVRSRYFQEHFDRMTWEKRKAELLEKSKNGALLVDFARDEDTGKTIGYCVSTINDKIQGEIESIFIEEGYRRAGTGGNFMKRALSWMDGQSVARRVIAVAAGNEETLGFYAKYSFYPRVSILMQVEDNKK